LKFSSDLNLLAVEGWVFPVCKDRRVRDLSQLSRTGAS
jgi:hypothetical protein